MIYGSKYREKRDKVIRTWMEERTQIIDNIPDNYFKAICYNSLIECFAQEYSAYPTGNMNATAFCDFILTFQKSYGFLDKIDPVTLYYYFEAELQGQYDLSFLDNPDYYNPNHAIKYGKASEMVSTLKMLGVKNRFIERHRYVRLLYSLRSKLSHELSSHNGMMSTDLHLLSKYPYYIHCFASYLVDGQVWELVVPVGFIKKLALECINNYLDYSLENKDDPFENDRINRKSHIAWYD